MELFTLDPSTYQPKKLVENYKSLIWTERYSQNGDFEVQGNNIQELMTLLPKETPCAIRESDVPMMIEDHEFDEDRDGIPFIKITGRTFETVLERRGSVNTPLPLTTTKGVWTVAADKESDAAYKVLRLVIGDIQRLPSLPAIAPAATPLDALPMLNPVLPADYATGTTNTYEVKFQNLYRTVMEFISINYHGLKAVRPLTPTDNQIDIEIYNGANRTTTVVFDAVFDAFDKQKYLLSSRGSANVGYVFGAGVTGGGEIVAKTAGPVPAGLDRRVLVLDGTSDAAFASPEGRKTRGLVELYKYNATALFSGEVAEQVADDYNTKYFLGDIIRLNGKYGLGANVRVAEFIRSFDATGEKAYPAFEEVVE